MLDVSNSDAASSVSPFSSISQVTYRLRSPARSSGSQHNLPKTSNNNSVKVKSEPSGLEKTKVGESWVGEEKRAASSAYDTDTDSSDLDPETVEETLSELNSFTLGEPGLRRTNSGRS